MAVLAVLVLLAGCQGAPETTETPATETQTTAGPTPTATTPVPDPPRARWTTEPAGERGEPAGERGESADEGVAFVLQSGDGLRTDRLTLVVGNASVPLARVAGDRLSTGDRVVLSAGTEGVTSEDLRPGSPARVRWRAGEDERTVWSGTVLPGAEVVTRTLADEDLGVDLAVTGPRRVVGDLDDRALGPCERFFCEEESRLAERARVSAYAAATVREPVEGFTVAMQYEESRLPENATEDRLQVFAYNDSVQTFVPLNSTVDADADTVTADRVAPGVEFESGGEDVTPTFQSLPPDTVFVVFDPVTWYRGFGADAGG